MRAANGPVVFVVEAPADADAALSLTAAVLRSHGLSPETSHAVAPLIWRKLGDTQLPRKMHGTFGMGRSPDFVAAKKALFVIVKQYPDAVGAVLLRDADNQPQRIEGLQKARELDEFRKLSVAVGLADPKREAWVLIGVARRSHRSTSVSEQSSRLTFDPTREPTRLNDPKKGNPRHIKTVVDQLCDDEQDQLDCIAALPVDDDHFDDRGTGYTAFIRELRTRILPLFTNPQR